MKLVLLMTMILVSSANFAAVGENNFQITIGGAMNSTTLGTNIGTTEETRASKIGFLGGGFDITVGHLYLSQGSLIHGFDTKLRFDMKFNSVYKYGGEKIELPKDVSMELNNINFSVGSTYIMGVKLGNGRLLVNVIGLNLGYLTGTFKVSFKMDADQLNINQRTGNSFLVGIDLPLGTQYIFDNGLSLGFSHRVDFAFGGEYKADSPVIDGNNSTTSATGSMFGSKNSQQSYLAYNLTVSLGYVFGK